MRAIRLMAAGLVLMLSAALTGCGGHSSAGPRADRIDTHALFGGKRQLIVAVHTDEPGIGRFDSSTGERSGLDIGVAGYVAAKLGMPWAPIDVRPRTANACCWSTTSTWSSPASP